MKQRMAQIVVCLFFLLLCTASGQAAEHVEVVAQGFAVIQDDPVQAMDEAIEDALRRGVEQALGSYIESYTLVQAAGLVEDTILAKSSGYVSSYVLEQHSIRDGFVVVVLRMMVQKERIENDLDALVLEIMRRGDPRLAILIPEMVHGEHRPHSLPERIIAEQFIQHGFSVVSVGDSGYRVDERSLSRALAGDAGSLGQLTRNYNVDFVILGSAQTRSLANLHGMISNQGTVAAKIIHLATGRVLADHSVTETGQHLTFDAASEMALQGAAERMTDFLLDAMTERFLSESNQLYLEVYGINYSELTIIKDRLQSMRSVRHVVIRSFAEDRGELEVSTSRTAAYLAGEMSEASWTEFPLEIVGVSGNTLVLRRF